MQVDWFGFVSQVVATMLGGTLVIVANQLNHRRQVRLEAVRQKERNGAIFTAIFTIRNFLLRSMTELEESDDRNCARVSFGTALANLNSVVEKSPPDTEFVMIANYEISLALGDLVMLLQSKSYPAARLEERTERLRMALENLAVMAGPSLSFTDLSEADGYVAREA